MTLVTINEILMSWGVLASPLFPNYHSLFSDCFLNLLFAHFFDQLFQLWSVRSSSQFITSMNIYFRVCRWNQKGFDSLKSILFQLTTQTKTLIGLVKINTYAKGWFLKHFYRSFYGLVNLFTLVYQFLTYFWGFLYNMGTLFLFSLN